LEKQAFALIKALKDFKVYIIHSHLGDKEIIQLKNNSFLKGLVPLEELFDHNDVANTPGVVPSETELEDFNIGTTNDPKLIKIFKNLPEQEWREYLALLKKYTKVFAWRYEDIKVYDTSIIQHTIPIKEDAKPFRKKLKRINPFLLPLIERESKISLKQRSSYH
jgi:hypothetical protein